LPRAEAVPDQPPSLDLRVLVPTLVLLALGVAMVFSASIPSAVSQSADMFSYLKREILYIGLGLVAMWGASRVPMGWLRDKAWVVFVVTVALLAGLFRFGAEINGSRAWYVVFRQSFQPSEMAKVVLVICAATYMARFSAGISSWRRALPLFAMLGLVAGLVALEPDMGTAVVIVMAMFAFLHVAGLKLRHLLAAGGVGAVAAAAMFWLHPYQWERIRNFYFPGPNAELGPGYQKVRSLIALGSGGLTGVGYFNGVEKYFYLPTPTTDSILPVVGEELGMIATWMVVAMFALLVWRGMLIAGRAPDRFSGLVAAGVTCLLGIQAIVNMAVATACIPPTGVPLPLVSYGGSSLLFSLIGIGLLLNVSRSIEWQSLGPRAGMAARPRRA
jgi:cell division protein FtsW